MIRTGIVFNVLCVSLLVGAMFLFGLPAYGARADEFPEWAQPLPPA